MATDPREVAMSRERARIVAAAIKQGEMVCSVPRPGRHYHIIRAMAGAGIPIPIVGEQGFLTNDGIFVDRRTAMGLAEEAGQVANETPASRRSDELFSEDLW